MHPLKVTKITLSKINIGIDSEVCGGFVVVLSGGVSW